MKLYGRNMMNLFVWTVLSTILCHPGVQGIDQWSHSSSGKAGDQQQDDDDDAAAKLLARTKLRPDVLHAVNGTVRPHEFLHLHHMKTGGTSIEDLLDCARQRLRRLYKKRFQIPYYSLHECDPEGYNQCLHSDDPVNTNKNKKKLRANQVSCRQHINQTSILSYCAPLSDLPTFGWLSSMNDNSFNSSLVKPKTAVTVLRDPVERVWSMYRYQTKECYQCKSLTKIYADMDANEPYTSTAPSNPNRICFQQLRNHQTRNLVTNPKHQNYLQQAKENLENVFTIVGLTEDLETTHKMIGAVAPWMAENFNGISCPLPRDNVSPKNNGCGQYNNHLPKHPPKKIQRLIQKHNKLDVQLYQFAVQRFELQKKALGLDNQDDEPEEEDAE